jgi:hypothetical protein
MDLEARISSSLTKLHLMEALLHESGWVLRCGDHETSASVEIGDSTITIEGHLPPLCGLVVELVREDEVRWVSEWPMLPPNVEVTDPVTVTYSVIFHLDSSAIAA